MNSGADRIVRHYHADHRGSDGTAFDEFAADYRLAGSRFCRTCDRDRAFQVNPVARAYTGIAKALNSMLTSLTVTLLERWLVWKRFNLVLVRSAASREGLGKWVPRNWRRQMLLMRAP